MEVGGAVYGSLIAIAQQCVSAYRRKWIGICNSGGKGRRDDANVSCDGSATMGRLWIGQGRAGSTTKTWKTRSLRTTSPTFVTGTHRFGLVACQLTGRLRSVPGTGELVVDTYA